MQSTDTNISTRISMKQLFLMFWLLFSLALMKLRKPNTVHSYSLRGWGELIHFAGEQLVCI